MKVIHCFRTPVGGLFRHVRDLVEQQHAEGLQIGIICDSRTGGERAEELLRGLEPMCELGIHRLPIQRAPGISDYIAARKASKICQQLDPDIVHGHGAKGGAYSRLLARQCSAHSVYTPHGGALHYNPLSVLGYIYFAIERFLRPNTDAMIFESQFSAMAYEDKIGPITCQHKVIHNGLNKVEFTKTDNSDSKYDVLYLGEFRKLKGVDVFVRAIAELRKERPVKALIIGEGRDAKAIVRLIRRLKLEDCIDISPPVFPARDAFKLGKCLVVPSRAESFPYIVLEAAAAGLPLIATNVGGIPEIFGPYSDRLISPDSVTELTGAMRDVVQADETTHASNHARNHILTDKLRHRIESSFTIEQMAGDIDAFYQNIVDARATS